MKWILGLQIVKLLNYGRPICRKTGVLVYYSNDLDEEKNAIFEIIYVCLNFEQIRCLWH